MFNINVVGVGNGNCVRADIFNLGPSWRADRDLWGQACGTRYRLRVRLKKIMRLIPSRKFLQPDSTDTRPPESRHGYCKVELVSSGLRQKGSRLRALEVTASLGANNRAPHSTLHFDIVTLCWQRRSTRAKTRTQHMDTGYGICKTRCFLGQHSISPTRYTQVVVNMTRNKRSNKLWLGNCDFNQHVHSQWKTWNTRNTILLNDLLGRLLLGIQIDNARERCPIRAISTKRILFAFAKICKTFNFTKNNTFV